MTNSTQTYCRGAWPFLSASLPLFILPTFPLPKIPILQLPLSNLFSAIKRGVFHCIHRPFIKMSVLCNNSLAWPDNEFVLGKFTAHNSQERGKITAMKKCRDCSRDWQSLRNFYNMVLDLQFLLQCLPM